MGSLYPMTNKWPASVTEKTGVLKYNKNNGRQLVYRYGGKKARAIKWTEYENNLRDLNCLCLKLISGQYVIYKCFILLNINIRFDQKNPGWSMWQCPKLNSKNKLLHMIGFSTGSNIKVAQQFSQHPSNCPQINVFYLVWTSLPRKHTLNKAAITMCVCLWGDWQTWMNWK